MTNNATDAILRALSALEPKEIDLQDVSQQHRKHPEGKSGAHYHLRIVSAHFTDVPPLARHKMIYRLIGDLAALNIHALSIDALTPHR